MTDAQRLGDLEQIVMLAVLRLGGDAYGAPIQRELAERAARPVSIATIHVTLTRLEAKGLVVSTFEEGTGARGGRSKRVFRVEQAGLSALRHARDALGRMWDGLEGGDTGRVRA
jgi:DNA-binding PadR family transcriptional regulator